MPAKGSARWRGLFSKNEGRTKPVDFHSFRRGFVQGLVAGVSEQQSMALANQRTSAARHGYATKANPGCPRTQCLNCRCPGAPTSFVRRARQKPLIR